MMFPSKYHTTIKSAPGQTNQFISYNGDQSHRERDDDYLHVLVMLSDRKRVIFGKPAQFILQSRRIDRRHGAYWRGLRYFLCRDALIKFCVASGVLSGADQSFKTLEELPMKASSVKFEYK